MGLRAEQALRVLGLLRNQIIETKRQFQEHGCPGFKSRVTLNCSAARVKNWIKITDRGSDWIKITDMDWMTITNRG